MESDAFDDESSSGSSSSLTPGVNLAQRMHMENELRELRSQQKSMGAEMRQMRRDMHQMRQRVHDSPSMVQQQAGLMLKANATDVKREIGRTRDELRERTDNIFTKEEYEVRLRSKASVEMVLTLVDKVLREVASATGTEEELGSYFRDQRLQISESKARSLEEHMMHMMDERDQEHLKVVKDVKKLAGEFVKTKHDAQKAANGNNEKIAKVEARVKHLEDKMHRESAIKHHVAMGLEATDAEVREHSMLLHEAVAQDGASQSSGGSHGHGKHGRKHGHGRHGKHGHKHHDSKSPSHPRQIHATDGATARGEARSPSTDRQTPTASHAGSPPPHQLHDEDEDDEDDEDDDDGRAAYEDAVRRVAAKKEKPKDLSKMTVRDRAAYVIQMKVKKRQKYFAVLVSGAAVAGKAMFQRKELLREEEEEAARIRAEQLAKAELKRKAEEESINREISAWTSEQDSPAPLVIEHELSPVSKPSPERRESSLGQIDDASHASYASSSRSPVQDDPELSLASDGSSIQRDVHDSEVLVTTLADLRNRMDRLEQQGAADGAGASPTHSKTHHKQAPGLSNLRLSTLEKTVHALAQEQAGISAVGKHTATNLGEIDNRLDTMAKTVVQVLESEAKRLAWDEAQVKSLKERCDEIDNKFNDLRTDISRRLNQLRSDMKEKMAFMQKKAGKAAVANQGGGARGDDDDDEEVDVNAKLDQMQKEIRGLKAPLVEEAANLKFEAEGVVTELHRHQQLYRDMLSEYMLAINDIFAAQDLSKAEVARLRDEQLANVRGLQDRLLHEATIAYALGKRGASFQTPAWAPGPETHENSAAFQDILPTLRSAVTKANLDLQKMTDSPGKPLPLGSEEAQPVASFEAGLKSGRSLIEQLNEKHRDLTRKAYRQYTPGGFSLASTQVDGSSISDGRLSPDGTAGLWEPDKALAPGQTMRSSTAREGGMSPPRNSSAMTATTRSLDFDVEYSHQPQHVTSRVPHRPGHGRPRT